MSDLQKTVDLLVEKVRVLETERYVWIHREGAKGLLAERVKAPVCRVVGLLADRNAIAMRAAVIEEVIIDDSE